VSSWQQVGLLSNEVIVAEFGCDGKEKDNALKLNSSAHREELP
jgi:hypothetical protein